MICFPIEKKQGLYGRFLYGGLGFMCIGWCFIVGLRFFGMEWGIFVRNWSKFFDWGI